MSARAEETCRVCYPTGRVVAYVCGLGYVARPCPTCEPARGARRRRLVRVIVTCAAIIAGTAWLFAR